MPTNPDIEFFARTDREVTPSNPDIDTSSQRPKDGDRDWQRPIYRGRWTWMRQTKHRTGVDEQSDLNGNQPGY